MNYSVDDFELREIQMLEGHTGKVLGIDWKSDTGIWGFPAVIASWSDDDTVRIWEQNFSGSFECKLARTSTNLGILIIYTSNKYQAVLEVSQAIRSCAWSPPFKLLAVACSDATTIIWKNVGVHDYERVYTMEGHDNEVSSVSWNSKGQLLACGGDKSIRIWEDLPGNEFDFVSVLQGHTEDVKIIHWESDVLYSGSCDNTIKVWEAIPHDSGNWLCTQTLGESDRGHTSTVRSLSRCKSEPRFVSCSDDLTIKIWSHPEADGPEDQWSHVCTLSGYHDRTIFSVDWLSEKIHGVLRDDEAEPDIIASAGADDAICLFIGNKDNEVDGLTFKLLMKKEKAHKMNVNSVKWHAGDRRLLASASDDGTVKIWDLICPYPAGHIPN